MIPLARNKEVNSQENEFDLWPSQYRNNVFKRILTPTKSNLMQSELCKYAVEQQNEELALTPLQGYQHNL